MHDKVMRAWHSTKGKTLDVLFIGGERDGEVQTFPLPLDSKIKDEYGTVYALAWFRVNDTIEPRYYEEGAYGEALRSHL